MRPPAVNPCGSCPYRRDVPSGVWSAEEYEKLPLFDRDTGEQPPAVFVCHQQDGRICAGWAGCHDMYQSLGLRFAILSEHLAPGDVDVVLEYRTTVPLWDSGQEAHDHGMRELESPSSSARRVVERLAAKGIGQ